MFYQVTVINTQDVSHQKLINKSKIIVIFSTIRFQSMTFVLLQVPDFTDIKWQQYQHDLKYNSCLLRFKTEMHLYYHELHEHEQYAKLKWEGMTRERSKRKATALSGIWTECMLILSITLVFIISKVTCPWVWLDSWWYFHPVLDCSRAIETKICT